VNWGLPSLQKLTTNFILYLDVTTGRFQKLKPIISNPLLLFCLNLSWHVFYATMGFTMTELAQRFKMSQPATSMSAQRGERIAAEMGLSLSAK
jgi:hypothetical protein